MSNFEEKRAIRRAKIEAARLSKIPPHEREEVAEDQPTEESVAEEPVAEERPSRRSLKESKE